MSKFDNDLYEQMIKDVLYDAIYVVGRPNSGIAASLRKYGELLLRKLVNKGEGENLTLGAFQYDKEAKDIISRVDTPDKRFAKAFESLRVLGNIATHTHDLRSFSDQDIASLHDHVRDIFTLLFVHFFTREKSYKFGNHAEVGATFSILPPEIRLRVLRALYEKDRGNLAVLDKLSLVLAKTEGIKAAMDLLGKRKSDLSRDVYEELVRRAKNAVETIRRNGSLYQTFEEAKELYLEVGPIKEKTEVAADFNSLMEFVYLGRKVEKRSIVERQVSYITVNVVEPV
ncbi:hypothetical protein [Terasakiella sp. SH-1]|uniref:hypothetical protein n=1 Tax=Terasakiella sp. SH-1 TaxID=2560057 RepID=UPI0010741D1E|nr:hypothetical protein [Terasakiella sp. SH-1]